MDDLARVLDAAPDIAVLLGADDAVVHLGSRFATLGWAAVSSTGPDGPEAGTPERPADVDDVVHAGHRARLADVLARARRGEEVAGFPLLISGRPPITVRAWVRALDDGRVVLWLRPRATGGHRLRQESAAAVGDINDRVLQAIATASYAQQRGEADVVAASLQEAAGASRQILRTLSGPSRRMGRPGIAYAGRASTAPTRTGRVRAVVADDTSSVRAQVRAVLGAVPGVEVVGEADDGRLAVAAAAELRPDLMLVDLSMPHLDGFEAIAAIREASPDTVVVALSGFSREQAADAAIRHGASAYLEKGGAVGKFAQLVDDLFPLRDRSPVAVGGTPSVPPGAAGAVAEIVAAYAHDLRNPLAAQVMAADLLLEQPDLGAASRKLAERILTTGARMERLIELMCDAGRIGGGSLDLVVAPVPAADLVAAVHQHAWHALGERLRFAADPEHAALVVPSDRARVVQVVENIVRNAVKFAPPDTPVRVGVEVDGPGLLLTVSDEGPGIAPADRERLFERFERLGATQAGFGLGMYLAREIARAHGGDLRVLEPRAGGATFGFRLPAIAARAG